MVWYGAGGGGWHQWHQLNLCLRPQTWEMKEGGGCYFIFFLCFVTIPIRQWPTTKTWEGQTNRLTLRRTPTHKQRTHPYILNTIINRQENQPATLCHADKWTHRHGMQIKRGWEWKENRRATTTEIAWGGGEAEKHACYCWLLAHEHSQMISLKGPVRLLGFSVQKKKNKTKLEEHTHGTECFLKDIWSHISYSTVLVVKLLFVVNCHIS